MIEWAFIIIGVGMFLYHMVCTQYLFVGSFEHQDVHLGFILVLTFLNGMRENKKGWVWVLQLLFILLSLIATIYVFVNLTHLEEVVGYPEPLDAIIGVILMLLVIEATRQAWGATLPVVAAVFISYFFFGYLLPGPLHVRYFNFDYIISYLCIGLTGIYGTFLSISANQIFLFVIFGALMGVIRITDFLYEMGKVVGRFLEGGPAQTAVVSSSLVGMVTGAAVANVAITGSFTIPYMKRVGYPPALAGGIEATASTGGQLMPPVMGASAFLMAFFVGVPYAEIMLAGILPAIFFYIAVFIGVQLISIKQNIQVPKESPDYNLILRRIPLFLLPLSTIVILLLLRFSPMLAAFWAILVAIGLSFIDKQTRPSPLELFRSLAKGALIGAKIGVSLCVVGMIAQTLVTTGLGAKIAGLVETLSGGNVIIALMITMLVSIILGCGVPPAAAYSLVAIVTVPVLIKMGVLAISAHFFCFYFAIISAVTPPVALGALAGAGIAGANYFRTALYAFKLSIGGFILPYLIVYNPVLNLHVENPFRALGSLIAIPLALTTLTVFIYNMGLVELSRIERVFYLIATASLFGYCVIGKTTLLAFEYPMFVFGILLFTGLVIFQIRKKRGR
ncbi:MAG: TRAP transporter fused permease subunit [Deltaproteobacteria bacterium]|nr:TRAP transporter fused permease subunit [Deltaproteobacteria bacterium]MBW2153853.1 TRAP transporter fused permease subunit [Deltaproteobacteria bacterium]